MTAEDRARARWGLIPGHDTGGEKVAPRQEASNSLPEDSYCPPRARIGVDTVSWAWADPVAVDRFLRLDGFVPDGEHAPLRLVPAGQGSARLSRRQPGLGTVGVYPSASLLYVEGRAAALATRDEEDHSLAPLHHLDRTQAQVVDDLTKLLGARPDTKTGLRRADLAGELAFDRGEDGCELLELLALIHSPRLKLDVIREAGGSRVETVYWRTPQRSVAVLRAYDKGVESGTAPAGERIRIERQLRYGGSKRPMLEQWLEHDIGDLYSRPILTWLRGGGIAAGTADQLMRMLTDAAVIWPSYWSSGSSWCSETGRSCQSLWPTRKVERVLGTLAIASLYGRQWPAWSSKQRQRRMAEVRGFGLLLTDHPVRVDVDRAIVTLCDQWRRAA